MRICICYSDSMRSAVSVILSSPTPDPNMSRPDYEQVIHDHAAILILVRHLGKKNILEFIFTSCIYVLNIIFTGEELTVKHFIQLFERINKVSFVKIKENNGTERTIWARYLKEYPVGNNDWGDFQTHRRLLGLITLGKIFLNSSLISE